MSTRLNGYCYSIYVHTFNAIWTQSLVVAHVNGQRGDNNDSSGIMTSGLG